MNRLGGPANQSNQPHTINGISLVKSSANSSVPQLQSSQSIQLGGANNIVVQLPNGGGSTSSNQPFRTSAQQSVITLGSSGGAQVNSNGHIVLNNQSRQILVAGGGGVTTASQNIRQVPIILSNGQAAVLNGATAAPQSVISQPQQLIKMSNGQTMALTNGKLCVIPATTAAINGNQGYSNIIQSVTQNGLRKNGPTVIQVGSGGAGESKIVSTSQHQVMSVGSSSHLPVQPSPIYSNHLSQSPSIQIQSVQAAQSTLCAAVNNQSNNVNIVQQRPVHSTTIFNRANTTAPTHTILKQEQGRVMVGGGDSFSLAQPPPLTPIVAATGINKANNAGVNITNAGISTANNSANAGISTASNSGISLAKASVSSSSPSLLHSQSLSGSGGTGLMSSHMSSQSSVPGSSGVLSVQSRGVLAPVSSATTALNLKTEPIKQEIKNEVAAETQDVEELQPTAGPTKEEEPEMDIFINNVVCSFSVKCHLNLKEIALTGSNVEYRRENGMVTMKLRHPYTTASIWSSGKVTCTGANTEEDARLAARKFSRILQKLDDKYKNIGIKNWRIVNVLGTCNLPFGIKIVPFSQAFKEASYEPELHPGVTYKLKHPKATLKIFSTGSITVTAPSVANVQAAVEHIYPKVCEYQKPKDPEELKADLLRGIKRRHYITNAVGEKCKAKKKAKMMAKQGYISDEDTSDKE